MPLRPSPADSAAPVVPAVLRGTVGTHRVRVDARAMLAAVPADFLTRLVGNTWTSGSWTYPPLAGWVQQWAALDVRVATFLERVSGDRVGVTFEVNSWAAVRWCAEHRRGTLLDGLLRRWASSTPSSLGAGGLPRLSEVDVAVALGVDARARALRVAERDLLVMLAEDVTALVDVAVTAGLLRRDERTGPRPLPVDLRDLLGLAPYLFLDRADFVGDCGDLSVRHPPASLPLTEERMVWAAAYLIAGVRAEEVARLDPGLVGSGPGAGGLEALRVLGVLRALR